ncbi:MAG: hypothetical protein WAX77_09555 [Methylococcaceae bacterium]
MNKIKKLILLGAVTTIVGCAAGGMNNGGYSNPNPYGMGNTNPYGNNPYGTAQPTSPLSTLEGMVLNSIIQSMAGSVLNGQIGSQLAPTDQNFRLQQLGGVIKSGAFNQAQQWVNPQTGNMMALNPIGQAILNPKTKQNCRLLEEIVTLKTGQVIKEQRKACLSAKTKTWELVQ